MIFLGVHALKDIILSSEGVILLSDEDHESTYSTDKASCCCTWMTVDFELEDDVVGLRRAFARVLAPFGDLFPVLLHFKADGGKKESLLNSELAGDHF